MTRPSANQIRRQFIDYFAKKHGHTFVPSSPCVPADDPTLMFTNAGMNQFKPIFLGAEQPKHLRVANSQKCIRAGGKHNDLDDVGHDTYHHTFFEMLGNWSFGDYFKAEAIALAWDLLTNVWGLEKDRLYATYFEGDAAEGLEPDTEARDLWLRILPPERVHAGNKKDNFWEMGDTGPCGPCSEIHIDLTPDKSGGPLVNAGDARVIEIWNLVFIQFNRGADRKLTPLPAKHVDTGMGFERITAIIQGVDGNYATDLFTSIFAEISKVTGAPAYTGLLEDDASKPTADIMRDVAYRVIADHIRCLVFAITDGAVPDNEGRGYVLRRILRRAVRYGRQYFDTSEPFMHKLVAVIADTMAGAFPELKDAAKRVADIVLDEEASFSKTLDRGISLFEQAAEYATKHHHGRIGGEDAFKLHDTYGFPVDLTELMAEERGLTVNIGEYERLMGEARERARSVGAKGFTSFLESIPASAFSDQNVTDDSLKYARTELEARQVSCTFDALGKFPKKQSPYGGIAEGCIAALGFDVTCFYAEQGGQIGDTGKITTETGEFIVEDTLRKGVSVMHIGVVSHGHLLPSQRFRLVVDATRRQRIMRNHTATHILNLALREVLGDHVQQKGSLVDPDKTRFDLSHKAPISEVELARIEAHVNRLIEADLPVYSGEAKEVDARKINTLRAVFGEKYPETVRIVSIGVPIDDLMSTPDNPEWMKYSVEFCGGTHLKRTGEAGRFRLIEESAVAKGIRRVVGVTGERAQEVEAAAMALARQLKEAAGANDAALPQRITEIAAVMNQAQLPIVEKLRLRADLERLQQRAKQIQKQAAKTGAADALARVDELLQSADTLNGCALITVNMGQATIDQLRAASDALRSRAGSAAVFLASESEGKAVLLAAMTKDLTARGIKAGDLMKSVAPIVGGRGGGRPDMAQGGGPQTDKIDEAVQHAVQWLRAAVAS